MKRFILLLILFLIGIIAIAQTKFQATNINIAIPDSIHTDSLIWQGWQESNVIILISEQKINIYSNFEQEYIPISGKMKTITPQRESIEFDALDVFNNRVTIELVHWKEQDGDQIYITWDFLALCYQIEKL